MNWHHVRPYFNANNVIVVSVAIAAILFFFIHSVAVTVWGTVMYGEIWINRPCEAFDYAFDATLWDHCGAVIPYRWILAGAVLAIAVAAIGRARKNSN